MHGVCKPEILNILRKYYSKPSKFPVKEHGENGKIEFLIETVNEQLRGKKKTILSED